ncbi:16S rRNA (cytidine(1402)-2'-O)-methyltransferase [Candidatus Roizmanbacteria bacterium]|nr:16S rRNA (cytidine(1402)-2'-O)-methyltransferase [Candidatus Roizmanbacteria bacterium]
MISFVATPIGNLQDISFRAADTILSAEILLCEDTRTAGMLLKKLTEFTGKKPHSSQRLVSYYKDQEFQKLPQVLDWIEEDKTITLISESGMPIVSDPGFLLASTLIKRQIPFTVIPGPSAATTALLYSGFKPEYVLYLGFLPKKTSQIEAIFEKMKAIRAVLKDKLVISFYESPNRIQETLACIEKMLPDAEVSVSRELTKLFEETVRGSAQDLKTRTYKGEITVVVQI